MTIGSLGDITFEVDDSTIRTINAFKWSGKARIETHPRHNYHSLTEYTGIEPDHLTIDIYLSNNLLVQLGTDVQKELGKIWKYEREGETLPLTVGQHAYGKYRWLIADHDFTEDQFDGIGNLLSGTCKLSLVEYLRK